MDRRFWPGQLPLWPDGRAAHEDTAKAEEKAVETSAVRRPAEPNEQMEGGCVVMPRQVIPCTKPFMSVSEVATVFCISKATVHRSLKKGDLPIRHFVINGAIRFMRRDVQALLYGNPPEPDQAC